MAQAGGWYNFMLDCAPQQLGTLEMHGGVRFSIGAFNTDEQVDAAIHAVAEIVGWAAAHRQRPATLTAS
jgi:selenocysteine lyase/cysteine desulfurase